MTADKKAERLCKSGEKMLGVLDALCRNGFHGYSATEISRETGLSLSDINTYVNTLVRSGYAERIPETGRIRPGMPKFARVGMQIWQQVDAAANKVGELKTNLSRA